MQSLRVLLCFLVALGCRAEAPAATSLELSGVPGGKRTLVLLQKPSVQATHSHFFGALRDRGHELTFALASSKGAFSLSTYGVRNFDNLCIFAPTATSFGDYSVYDVLDFMKSGGNVLVAGAAKTGDVVRHLAAEVGVDVDKKGSQVLDNVSYDAKLGAVVSYGASPLLHVLHSAAGPETPVRFQGIGHSIDASNHLAVKILEGNPTSFSAKPGEATGEKPESIGPDTLLASGLQGHNNARFVFCGSLPLFSDAFHNEDFALQMAKWAFAENGIIRFANVTHSRVDGSPPELLLKQKEKPDLPKSLFPDPEITRNSLVYRIKDMLYYEVTINTWDGDAQAWAPFHAEDVQLEFVMLDPYIRTTLTSDGDGKFSTSFMAPDKYGIFKFKLLYRRPGLSTLHVEKVVSVRPFKHNEYERYITSAYPYYTAAFVLMAAVTVFSFLFLFTEDKTVLSKTHRD